MRHGRLSLAFWAACAPAAAAAQAVVTSPGPEWVAVTVYRDPDRAPEAAFTLEWLNGFALISETRRVVLPAGEAEIRFEGVAGGIVPQSAIVTGLPDGIVERNRDAYLLSPESLLDRSLGRRVHLRRTSRATGRVTETEAVVLSGAEGAVVVQTREGAEALRCTGQSEQLVYPGVPTGLSARPTLSVRTRAAQPVAATVTLSYLASGFDWQANYIANLSGDGERIDLFAWLTMANGDETGFANAETQAVAGRLNREQSDEGDENEADGDGTLVLQCWPSETTSSYTVPNLTVEYPVTSIASEEIRLQGMTRTEDLINALPQAFAGMSARQEELGDLKLYRIPEPVTVAARSQKQVAFLIQPAVQVRFAYRTRLDGRERDELEPPTRLLRTRNRREDGLGLPLPGGTMQLFTEGAGRPILIGEGALGDYAVNEDVEIEVGEAAGVFARIEWLRRGRNWRDYRLIVTNDRAVPVQYEAEFSTNDNDQLRLRPHQRLGQRNGTPLWTATVPANGSASLRYRIVNMGGDPDDE